MTMVHDQPPSTPGHQGRTLRCEVRIDAPPERVWEAWADPAKIAAWFTDRAAGEARTGETITWFFDDFGYVLPYHVVDAAPPRRLALGGELPGRPPFLLEVLIARDGGSTLLRLVNSGFLDGGQWDEEYEGVASGWENALAILKYYVEHHFGQPKQSFLAMQPARFSFDRIRRWFLEPELLTRWLTTAGGPSAVGEPYTMTLADGTVVRGRTLAVTKREVALSWEAERMTLELKAFPHGPGTQVVCVRGMAWGADPERVRRHRTAMESALARLATALQKSDEQGATSHE